jgi:hypothetical protein
MPHTLLIYQNTEPWNGLSQEGEERFMHPTSDAIAELSATGERFGAEES